MVQGPIDDGSIKIVDNGVDYKQGDVLYVDQTNFGVKSTDGTFTVLAAKMPDPATLRGTGQKLDDILGKIGSIGGNLTQALKFENITSNVFPFELPPNLAVSDLYQFGTGGASKPEPQLPSIESLADKVGKVAKSDVLPDVPFIEPSIGEEKLDYNTARRVINAPSGS